MALGAEQGSILKLVVGQGMVLVFLSIALGIIGALATAQVLASLLYGISPRDPATYVAVTSVLTVVAAVALLPARASGEHSQPADRVALRLSSDRGRREMAEAPDAESGAFFRETLKEIWIPVPSNVDSVRSNENIY